MNWKIQIDGDKKYIDDLIDVFKALNLGPLIYREGDSIYLGRKMFDSITDAKDISSIAKTLLTLISIASPLKRIGYVEPLKISKFFYKDKNIEKVFDSEGNIEEEISEDGKKETFLRVQSMSHTVVQANLTLIGEEGTISYNFNTIESIKDYLKTHSDPENLKNVADYLKPPIETLLNFSHKSSSETPTKDIVEAESKYGEDIELAKWTALRKIYETIRDDKYFKNTNFKSGFSFIKHTIGEGTADDLYSTVCNQLHTETTTEERNYKKPKRIVPLSEAEELISTLLSKYIEEKAKEVKST